jgi:hypothetical protein
MFADPAGGVEVDLKSETRRPLGPVSSVDGADSAAPATLK